MEGDFDEGEITEGALEDEESAPVITLANRIIEDAYYSGGSDIHIEPGEKTTRVRVRIDGNCQEKLTIPAKVSGALVARLKVMSNLDIAEKRLPQDGRIVFKQFTRKNLDIDLRVSTAPLNHGEGVVMRILDKQKSTLPLHGPRLRAGEPRPLPRPHPAPLWHGAALRPHRLRQVHDALLRAQRNQLAGHGHPHRRGSD